MGGTRWRKCVARWNLSLANTLFADEKTENASEFCEWQGVPASGRDVRVRQNNVERSRIVWTVPECSRRF